MDFSQSWPQAQGNRFYPRKSSGIFSVWWHSWSLKNLFPFREWFPSHQRPRLLVWSRISLHHSWDILEWFAQSCAELQKGLKKGKGKALLAVQKWEQGHPCLQSQCTQLKWEWVFPTKNNLPFSDVMNLGLKQNFNYKVATEFWVQWVKNPWAAGAQLTGTPGCPFSGACAAPGAWCKHQNCHRWGGVGAENLNFPFSGCKWVRWVWVIQPVTDGSIQIQLGSCLQAFCSADSPQELSI